MTRTIRLILLGLLLAGIAFLVLKLRSSRAPESSLDTGVPLTGSLDTWPDVPEKNIASLDDDVALEADAVQI